MRIALLTALIVASCDGRQPEVAQTATDDTCNAGAHLALIGELAEAAQSLPEPKRIYRLGDPVTMDFNPSRLNVKLDDGGTIMVIDCG
jgi:hypothetical protein